MAYGTASRVTELIESIVTVAASGATISTAEIDSSWLPVVDALINAHLRSHYEVPLRTLNGSYPMELVEAASLWTAGLICQERFSQDDPNASARGALLVQEAQTMILEMKSDINVARLPGQRRRSHNHFVDPAMMPAAPVIQGSQQPAGPGTA